MPPACHDAPDSVHRLLEVSHADRLQWSHDPGVSNASSDRLDNTSKRRNFQDDLSHLDMESPAVVGVPLAWQWIESSAIRLQEEYGNENDRGMFPSGQLQFCGRQNSDGLVMAARPRCDRTCRPAAIFFAAGNRVRQDQAEL